MKKFGFICITIILTFIIVGCYKTSEIEDLVGYIFFEDNRLYFDEVEIITLEDKVRIEELNLTETTKKQEFLDGSSYQDTSLEKQKIVYFISIQDSKVISIKEKLILTQ